MYFLLFFFFKQKTAYDLRISDWSSDVCSSDLVQVATDLAGIEYLAIPLADLPGQHEQTSIPAPSNIICRRGRDIGQCQTQLLKARFAHGTSPCSSVSDLSVKPNSRSEEHTSELQSLMRTSYAVFCLKNKKTTVNDRIETHTTSTIY